MNYASGTMPRARTRGRLWRQTLRRLIPRGYAWTIRTWLLSTPGLAGAYIRINPLLRPRRVTRSTTLAIDGFPRSANGYVSYALAMLLPDDALLSTMTHAPHTVRAAARMGRPCVLLIRQPDDVVASILTYDLRQTAEAMFRAYAIYYEAVQRASSRVVVADFAEATHDIASVARRLEERYGMGIPEERARALRPEQVFARLDDDARAMVERDEITPESLERRISRPVEGRQHVDVSDPDAEWADSRRRAWRAYHAVVGEPATAG